MTFIEGLWLLLDVARVDKTGSSKYVVRLAVLATISQTTKLRVVRNRA